MDHADKLSVIKAVLAFEGPTSDAPQAIQFHIQKVNERWARLSQGGNSVTYKAQALSEWLEEFITNPTAPITHVMKVVSEIRLKVDEAKFDTEFIERYNLLYGAERGKIHNSAGHKRNLAELLATGVIRGMDDTSSPYGDLKALGVEYERIAAHAEFVEPIERGYPG